MKKIYFLFAVLFLIQSCSYAETVYDDNYQENPNYVQGRKYLENSQYSSAINEFKKAIRTNAEDKSALIGLSNAYNMRAQYYNNIAKLPQNAITDLKSAVFFLKYFYNSSNDSSLLNSISAMEKNLSVLENSTKSGLTSADRLKEAKILRTKGEFAAAGYDYYQLLNSQQYKAQAGYALGDIYTIFNRPDEALKMYKTAVNLNPSDTELHLKLARTYEQLNDFNASLKEYNSALDTSSERGDILTSLERIWQKKVDENPNDAESHANLGVVYQKEKRYQEALEEYRKAEALNPSNINTKINIGTLYQEQKKYDSAIGVYDNILANQPHNVNVMIYKAECLKALAKNEDAVNLYKAVLSLEPDNTAVKAELFELMKNTMSSEDVLAFLYKNVQNSPMNADAYYQFAYELHKANKLDDAINYYNETLKLDNKKIDAYINLSQAYRQKQDYVKAYEIINKAKSIAPDNELVKNQYDIISKDYTANKYTLASNAFESGDYNKAIEEYKKINPPTSDSYIGIAASYQSLNNLDEAVNYYKKAIELNQKNADLPYYIASIYISKNDIASAKPYVEMALVKNPAHKQAKELKTYLDAKETETKLTSAIKLYDNKKYNEAIVQLDAIIKVDSQNSTAYYYRAMAYDALKNYNKAVSDYKMTLKYAPDMVIAYYSLGVDYDALNDFKSAKDNYTKYVKSTQDDNDYKKYAQSRIDEIK